MVAPPKGAEPIAMGIALFPWVTALLLASSSAADTADQRESPKVSTENGVIRGKLAEASEDRVVAAFLGVPYARAPIGDLRWAGEKLQLNAATVESSDWSLVAQVPAAARRA